MSIRGTAHPVDDSADPPADCRDDILRVNGVGVGLRFGSDPAGGWTLQSCRVETFGTGRFDVATERGSTTGIVVDQLIFHADASTPLLADDRPAPPIDDLTRTDTGFRARVDNAQGVYWLVQAASADPGWAASIGASSVGAPILVNGFGSAWFVEVPDNRRQTISIHMAAQGKINVAVLLSAVIVLVVLVVAVLAARRPVTEDEIRPPEPLRFLHTTIVALIALGVFSLGAGPIPGLVAGAAALVLDTRLGWRRWITWIPGLVILVLAVVAAVDRNRPLGGWADVAVWSAVALASTAALVDSERRPPPSPVLL